jgi:stage IV sporulation protein FB
LNFRLFGIPVRIHPFFWVIMLLLGPLRSGPKPLVARIVAALVSILMHELGHAAAMRSFGIYPSIVLYGMGGLTIPGAASYRSREPGPNGRVLISIAGPAAGFGLDAILYAILKFAGYGIDVAVGLPYVVAIEVRRLIVFDGLTFFVYYLFVVNILWGLINLLPILPLDGGQIAREVCQQASPAYGARVALVVSAIAAISVAMYAGVEWRDWWIALFFGYLGFISIQALAAYGRY